MRAKKDKIIAGILKIALPYLKDFIRVSIKEGHLKKDEVKNILIKLKEAFADIKKPKFKQKIKEFFLTFILIEYEGHIEDKILSRSVKILKNDIIKKKEREKLAEYFAADLARQWRKIEKEDILKVENFLTSYLKVSDKNKHFTENVPEIISLLSFYYFQKISEKSVYRILELLKEILDKVEYKEPMDIPLKMLSKIIIEELNIRDYLRKSLVSILAGDLILYSLGKALGVKERLSVVDFTTVVGTKIVENQIFKKLKKGEAKEISQEINKLKS